MNSRGLAGGWKLLAKFFAAAVSSALTIVLLEAGSHLFGSFEGPLQPLRVGNIQIFGQHDPLLFWSLRPSAEASDGSRWINSDGLRGPEVGPKQLGDYRILSLGESTTFAAQMEYENSYSAVLEQLLNEKSREAQVRVLNAGVPGYTLFQGVHFLKHRGLRFKPEMVLLYFGLNDYLPAAYLAERAGEDSRKANGMNDWELFEQRQTASSRFLSFLTQHSNLIRGVLQLRQRDQVEQLRSQTGAPRVPLEHRKRLLELADAFCQQHGIKLVIIVPIYRSFTDHAKLLLSYAEANGVAVVDLPGILPRRFTRHKKSYFLDDAHPTPEGHRLIAQAIAEVVSPQIK